ncbi:zinc finger protein 891-like [Drosophila sulfurigaster albostrigata]|uniref:Zinc finger protein 891-like n=1 Tax=Drosophila albomicans TaxID=7291 RepID=A0A6P8X8C6_DROAB|nr:zinc finger protein 891-like [Drosophila albomicans]XP_060660723.1 zinc finger protein 891-like [Drosophila nasuta]XP_062136895.1 zinc finger protein 891-like [Drosophila sulfurigaster albostrigata]
MVEQVCRACRESAIAMVYIFDERYQQQKDEPSLAEMLSELAACEVKRNDPLPQQMCLACVLAAQNAFRFKRKCEQSHQHFWHQLSGSSQTVKLEDSWQDKMSQLQLNIAENYTAANDELVSHIKAEAARDSHICPTCGKVFETRRQLMLHQSFHDRKQSSNSTGAAGGAVFQCPHCEKSFNGNWWLQRHLRTHTGERPYKCSHCEKAFKDSWSLRRHLRTHLSECSYKCLYCPKTFNNANSQRIHICTHTGDYPYKCNQCQSSYAQPGSLKRHMRIHTDEGSFKCPHCPQVFAVNYNLKRHMSTHIT